MDESTDETLEESPPAAPVWHISLDAEGRIRQFGQGLGALDGCAVYPLTEQEYADVCAQAATAVDGDGYLIFHIADRTVQRVPASPEWLAAEAARQAERAALVAAAQAHSDPLVQHLARLAGIR